ncbi:hypothetical protein [Sinosporangium siamense]|uniref:Uncharacterized protein n=1 Tax=Sinosporangium siamense TaxID=1367973 RepID=A0A919V7F3_9ACTN|nr:hypothetical protein [Sinosporangium siamense]GII93031.1 hypothetical protein Ssi02_32620 [Sinosporangium siamense]
MIKHTLSVKPLLTSACPSAPANAKPVFVNARMLGLAAHSAMEAPPSLTIALPASCDGRWQAGLGKLRHVEFVALGGEVVSTGAVSTGLGATSELGMSVAGLRRRDAQAFAEAAYEAAPTQTEGPADVDALLGDDIEAMPALAEAFGNLTQQTANGGLRLTQQCDPNTWRQPVIT